MTHPGCNAPGALPHEGSFGGSMSAGHVLNPYSHTTYSVLSVQPGADAGTPLPRSGDDGTHDTAADVARLQQEVSYLRMQLALAHQEVRHEKEMREMEKQHNKKIIEIMEEKDRQISQMMALMQQLVEKAGGIVNQGCDQRGQQQAGHDAVQHQPVFGDIHGDNGSHVDRSQTATDSHDQTLAVQQTRQEPLFAQCALKEAWAPSVIALIREYQEGKSSAKQLALPVRAAIDAGVISRPTFGQYTAEFGQQSISKSTFESYMNPQKEPFTDEAYAGMVEQFKQLKPSN